MRYILIFVVVLGGQRVFAQAGRPPLQPMDVFELEWVTEPQVSPDGERVAYLRNGYDVMTDRATVDLWLVGTDGSRDRPLVTGPSSVSTLRWSPDGDRLLYASNPDDAQTQLYAHYFDSEVPIRLTGVRGSIRDARWSPDGERVAFTATVPYEGGESVVSLPAKPEGAEWADAAKYVDRFVYRADGRGYLEPERTQLFVVAATGGTAHQLTDSTYDVTLDAWSADGTEVYVSVNTVDTNGLQPQAYDIAAVDAESGAMRTVVATPGPDGNARLSPDGKTIAYLSSPDERRGYENAVLYTRPVDAAMDAPGRALTAELDRSVGDFAWTDDGLVVDYDDAGDTKLARVSAEGKLKELTGGLGGTSLGRPYSGGQYSVATDGTIAYTQVGSDHPAELAVYRDGASRTLTDLNGDLIAQRGILPVEEMTVPSSAGGESIQAWLIRPPNFDPAEQYPLILEIHGGPYANYGDRFAMEMQLYAAAGYLVVYANPRGSTSYGERFANLIEDNYPGEDYDDLMSVVDAVIAGGSVDTSHLYVTGGSGGGLLTAWIVGKTDRFRAAVVAKPVINWASFVLYADATPFFSQYWFSKPPWEDYETYWRRSPLSLVGNVTTPTMLLTGESDYRTPIPESEQYYTALKLRGVPTAMVRIPGAGHGITTRPSNLMAKVSGVLGWFERFK